MIYQLPDLPYAYDALEPHIDARTMEIHHTKHHAGYVGKLNAALEGRDLHYDSIDDLMADIGTLPEEIRTTVRNNGGGHANHSFFWTIMRKGGGGVPRWDLAEAIDRDLGGFDRFQDTFTTTAMNRFGSGWAWLSLNADGKLLVGSTPNQDSPRMHKFIPVLGLDLWEHAYYLKYQNRRADYVDAFWNVIDWEAVTQRYLEEVRRLEVVHH